MGKSRNQRTAPGGRPSPHPRRAAALRRHFSVTRARLSAARARGRHRRDVAAARQRYERLKDPRGVRLARFDGIRLYAWRIRGMRQEASIVGVSARVHSSGSRVATTHWTTPRVVLGGLLLGRIGLLLGALLRRQSSRDFRELFLAIAGPGIAIVIECNPARQLKARRFAERVNSRALAAAREVRRRGPSIRAAKRDLDRISRDVANIRAAERRLQSLIYHARRNR